MILRKLSPFRGHHSSFFLVVAALFLFAAFFDRPVAAETVKPPILSAAEIDYPPFSIVNDQGRAGGFSVELMRAALEAVGRDVTFRTGPWAEVRGWLETSEVKALPLVGRTPERELIFDFTVPYMSLSGAIVVRKDTTGIQDLTDLQGRTVAVMKGDNAEEFLRRNDWGIKIHTTATFEAALQELARGLHDAVVMQRLVALRLLEETGLTGLRIISKPIKGFSQDFCFAVQEGDRETLALLNEGLAVVMADGTYRHLHAKWFAALELPAGRRIVIGGDHAYPPFEYLDENGRPAGYNVDLTRAIAREMGLDIEIRLGPWSEIVQGMEEGRIDLMQGMFYLPERDLKFDFTQPHTVHHYVSVVRQGEGDPPATLDDLAGKRIVVQRGDAAHDFLLGKGLAGRASLVETQEEVLRALSEGKHDCALAVRISALHLIEEQGWKNLILGQQAFLPLDYCYAAPNGHKALLATFSEGLKILDETGEHRRIYKKWLGAYTKQTTDPLTILRYAAVVIVPLLLVLLASLLWTWSLRRTVARRTAELAAVSQRHQAILAAAPDIIMEVNVDKVYTWANPAGFEFFGNDVIGRAAADYFVGVQETDQKVDALFNGDENVIYVESLQRRKDGQQRLLAWWCRVFKDSTGHVMGALSTARDITEQKKAEEALRSNYALLRIAGETARFGGWSVDLEKNTCTWSDAVADVHEVPHGYAPPVREGINFYAPEWHDKITQVFTDCAQKGIPYDEEMEIITKKGKRVWVRAIGRAVKDEKGSIIKVQGSFQDITEHKRQKDALRRSEERHRLLAENTLDVIWMMTMDARFTYVNPAIETMFGFTPDEWIGSGLWEHCDEQHFAQMKGLIEKEAARGPEHSGVIFETEMLKRDGSIVAVEIHGRVIFDDLGVPVFLQGMTRDVSERRRAETEQKKRRRSCSRPGRWSRWAGWPGAWPTTTTTCST